MTDLTPPPDDLPPYGAMASIMKDHLHIMECGHLYTTPCVSARLSLRFYVTIAVSANGQAFRLSSGEQVDESAAMVFRPSEPRALHARDVQMVAVLINPLHPDFPRFRSIAGSGVQRLDRQAYADLQDELSRAYRGELQMHEALALHEGIIARTVAQLPTGTPADPRALAVAQRVREDPYFTATAMARELGVSAGRLSHLFSANMGLSLRSYQLWAKVHRTTPLLAQGAKLTDVTHQAGFADQAHMRRVFYDVFGAPPSHFLRNPNVVMRMAKF